MFLLIHTNANSKMTVSNVKTGFGGDLDITKYKNRWSQEELNSFQKHAKFVKFSILDTSKYKIYDDELNNCAVRSDQNRDDATDDIAYSYESHGWDYNPFPPIISTKGRIRDGRTRIRAALVAGERWIPVAVYSYDEDIDELRSDVINGLLANFNHLVARRATMEDVITAGVHLISKGKLNHDTGSIDHWLYNDVEIERLYSNIAGTITKISNQIFQRATPNGEPIVVLKDRDEWISYLEGCKEIASMGLIMPDSPNPLNENQLVLYATGKTNAGRCWVDQILERAHKGDHTYIVLYSTAATADKVREQMKAFQSDLETFYVQTLKLINNQLSGIQLGIPDNRPYTILGAIPQFSDDEKHIELRSMNKIIPLDQF